MTTTAPNGIRPEQKLATLKHLAAGRTQEWTAEANRLTAEQVRQVAQSYGWPDRKMITCGAAKLEEKINRDRRALPEEPARAHVPPRKHVPAPPPAGDRSPHRPVSSTTSAEELLATARDSETASTRRLGDRISTLLATLGDRLAAEDARRQHKLEKQKRAAAAKAERDRQRAEAAAEIARLEGQLAAAKARLRQPATRSRRQDTSASSAQRVRAWARENDLECANTGRVPAHIRDAYAKAHPAAVLSEATAS